jgi:hypothetical protein
MAAVLTKQNHLYAEAHAQLCSFVSLSAASSICDEHKGHMQRCEPLQHLCSAWNLFFPSNQHAINVKSLYCSTSVGKVSVLAILLVKVRRATIDAQYCSTTEVRSLVRHKPGCRQHELVPTERSCKSIGLPMQTHAALWY